MNQVPWMELADRECHSFNYQNVKASILPELQKGLEMAVRRQFHKLLFLLGVVNVVRKSNEPIDKANDGPVIELPVPFR